MEPEYKQFIDKNGIPYLKEIGKIDIYQRIEESEAGTDLGELIKEFKLKTDEFDMTKLDETVIDVTKLPSTLMDTLNFINEQKTVFDTAPLEIKNYFGNNFYAFLAGAENGTLKSLLDSKKVKEDNFEEEEHKNSIDEQIAAAKAKLAQLEGENK